MERPSYQPNRGSDWRSFGSAGWFMLHISVYALACALWLVLAAVAGAALGAFDGGILDGIVLGLGPVLGFGFVPALVSLAVVRVLVRRVRPTRQRAAAVAGMVATHLLAFLLLVGGWSGGLTRDPVELVLGSIVISVPALVVGLVVALPQRETPP
jgi:hypothetical protein